VKKHLPWLLVLFMLCPLWPAVAKETPVEIEIQTTVRSSPLQDFLVTGAEIDGVEIAKKGAQNAGEVLQGTEGVTYFGNATPKGRSYIGIRGFGMQNIRVYLDGVPLNTPNDRIVDFSLIPTEMIDHIEVIRGSAPVAYGCDAMGGVINIVTRKGSDFKGFWLRYLAGSFGTQKGAIYGGMSSSRAEAFALARSNHTLGYTPHDSGYSSDGFFRGKFLLGNDIQAYAIYYLTNAGRRMVNPVNQDGSTHFYASGYWPGSTNWSFPDIHQEVFHVGARREGKTGLNWQADYYYHVYNDTLCGYVPVGTRTQPAPNNWAAYYRAGVENYSYWQSTDGGFIAKISQKLGTHRLEAGYFTDTTAFRNDYQGRSNRTDPPGSMSRPVDQWGGVDYWKDWTTLTYSGYYLQDQVDLAHQWHLTMGLRRDFSSRSPEMLNGNLNLVHRPGRDTWRFTIGTTGRFPTLSELQGKNGNPNLVPEHCLSMEAAFRTGRDGFDDAQLAVFRNDIDNLIAPENANVRGSRNVNQGRMVVNGVEASYRRDFTRDFYAVIQTTWLDRVMNGGEALPSSWQEFPRQQGSLELDWSREGNLGWNLEGILVGERTTGDAVTPVLSPYFLVNLRLAYSHQSPAGGEQTYEIIGKNLLNTRYQDDLYFYMPPAGVWAQMTVKL